MVFILIVVWICLLLGCVRGCVDCLVIVCSYVVGCTCCLWGGLVVVLFLCFFGGVVFVFCVLVVVGVLVVFFVFGGFVWCGLFFLSGCWV